MSGSLEKYRVKCMRQIIKITEQKIQGGDEGTAVVSLSGRTRKQQRSTHTQGKCRNDGVTSLTRLLQGGNECHSSSPNALTNLKRDGTNSLKLEAEVT